MFYQVLCTVIIVTAIALSFYLDVSFFILYGVQMGYTPKTHLLLISFLLP